MDPFPYEGQQWETFHGSDSSSSSTQCSGVLSVQDDDCCTSQPHPGSNWQSKLHIHFRDVLNNQPGQLQASAMSDTAAPVAQHPPRNSRLAIDVSGANSNNSTCSVDFEEPAAPSPAAFPPTKRTFQAPVINNCCTPSPRLSSPRVIFADSGTKSTERQHQQLQQWLRQRESRLAGASDPAAAIAQALPPPAFLIMGLLN